METPTTPKYHGLTYGLEDVKKSFMEYRLLTENRDTLTEYLRIEKNNGYNSTTGAENLLKMRDAKNWKKCTMTGLRPTIFPNFFYADLPVNGKKSLIICYLPENMERIYLCVCPEFYPFNSAQRNKIITEIAHAMREEIK